MVGQIPRAKRGREGGEAHPNRFIHRDNAVLFQKSPIGSVFTLEGCEVHACSASVSKGGRRAQGFDSPGPSLADERCSINGKDTWRTARGRRARRRTAMSKYRRVEAHLGGLFLDRSPHHVGDEMAG